MEQAISINKALDFFKLTINDLQKAISVAMSRKATYADIYIEYTTTNAIIYKEDKIDYAYEDIDSGAGIRVVSDEHSGYAYTEIITPKDLIKAANFANKISDGNIDFAPVNINFLEIKNNRYPILKSWDDYTTNDKSRYLDLLNSKIKNKDSNISNIKINFSNETKKILFINSEGDIYADIRPTANLSVSCIIVDGEKTGDANISKSFLKGYEFFDEEMIEKMAKELVDRARLNIISTKPQGGKMPVVMGCGESGILLHEAIGHTFEADFIRKKTSVFCNQLGNKICNSEITIVDDGTIPFNRGSINFDDEGIEGEKTHLITDGVLTGFLHDRISARHFGVKPTGNGRRSSFRKEPIPRMRSTYMENGNHSLEEMIAEVNKGVFVESYSNGEVEIGAGNFTFYVKQGYMIENGKLTTPIKDINVIGNGPEALANISMVGNDLEISNATWMCGKNGQNCPVSCGMPSVLVNNLTVGGE